MRVKPVCISHVKMPQIAPHLRNFRPTGGLPWEPKSAIASFIASRLRITDWLMLPIAVSN